MTDVPQQTHDSFRVLERADTAMHDVAQLHFHEFGEGQRSRARTPAHERPPHDPRGGRATASRSARKSGDGGRFSDVLRDPKTCYGGDDE